MSRARPFEETSLMSIEYNSQIRIDNGAKNGIRINTTFRLRLQLIHYGDVKFLTCKWPVRLVEHDRGWVYIPVVEKGQPLIWLWGPANKKDVSGWLKG